VEFTVKVAKIHHLEVPHGIGGAPVVDPHGVGHVGGGGRG
jgi:hypothetical protein